MNKFLTKVFGWMFIGLLITFVTGIVVANNENMLINVLNFKTIIILAIIELGLVITLSIFINKLNPPLAKVMYILYAFITGLTFSVIFVVYEVSSIIFVFLIAALVFLIFALLGYFTKVDLTKLGTYLFMALIALIIMIIVNIFMQSNMFNLVISCIGLLIFIGFTAYDVQKLKLMENNSNLAIYGALQLYLDFINIFLDLLNLIGQEK